MPVHTQAQAGDRDPLEEASELYDLAVSLRARGQYAEAMAASRQALAIFEREVGLGHPDVAKDLTQNNFSNFVSLKALYTLGRIV